MQHHELFSAERQQGVTLSLCRHELYFIGIRRKLLHNSSNLTTYQFFLRQVLRESDDVKYIDRFHADLGLPVLNGRALKVQALAYADEDFGHLLPVRFLAREGGDLFLRSTGVQPRGFLPHPAPSTTAISASVSP